MKNSYFNARNFFDPAVGHLAYNYFGGNIGGPIKKNKLFFFADYLKVYDHEANTNLITIPTMALRTGDLSTSGTAIYNPFSGNRGRNQPSTVRRHVQSWLGYGSGSERNGGRL